MPIGDPTWKCENCGGTYYNNSAVCDCPASENRFIELPPMTPVPMARAQTDTLVVNLFAGPGAGKSTTAAGIFYELKSLGINCELAAEYAKDLAWEERHQTFRDQIYLFGKQFHRVFRLLNQVSVIVTDSPILNTIIYDSQQRPTLKKLALEEHNKIWTYNVFIKRKKVFNPKGRIHNLEESMELDKRIVDMLFNQKIVFETFEGTPEGRDAIVKKVLTLLAWNDTKMNPKK